MIHMGGLEVAAANESVREELLETKSSRSGCESTTTRHARRRLFVFPLAFAQFNHAYVVMPFPSYEIPYTAGENRSLLCLILCFGWPGAVCLFIPLKLSIS